MKMKKAISALTAAMMLSSVAPSLGTFAYQTDTNDYVSAQNVLSDEAYDSINAQSDAYIEDTTVDAAAVLPYQDTSLSFEERAADLVARMTLEEKAAQTAAKNAPAISRLGVHSYYYWREGIHGVARQGAATSFPSSLAMSNTWDRELMFDAMDITSTEARGKNNRYDLNYWNPTINLARDPRWGRNEESYGEDPYLTSEIGGQAVKGMQGTDEKYLKTMTTLKHYAANNCEGERQSGTSIMNERTMREYYSRAFRDIVRNYDPAAVMSSYNGTTIYRNGEILTAIDGQKIDYIASSANSYLINDLLKRTYGFGGFVVGDCGAWDNAYGKQPLRQKLYANTALDKITAPMTVAKIIEAGSSLDCNSGANGTGQVAQAVQEGLISEDALDIVVYELFLERMKTGEFDKGAKYQDITSAVIETDEHVAKAEEAAEKTWVLLENKDNALPLTTESKTSNIAIVGSHASEVVLGDYSSTPTKTTTPYDGIKAEVQKLNPDANVELVGNISDQTPLFNIKSITLVKSTGKNTTLDLTKATKVNGMTQSGSTLTNITKSGVACIPSVDFKDVTDIKVEAASLPGMPNVTLTVCYESLSQPAGNVTIQSTNGESDYKENTGVYDGATGGYTSTADLYIKVNASSEFSVENFKSSLDKADYIIAYGGTTTADSSESHDRSSIDLPATEAHVQQICDAYPDKTIVVLQTVGQVNVENFKDKCAALLWTSYNGQTQGEALGKVLTGEVNPSGKLTTTWYTEADLSKMPIGTDRQKIDGIDYNFTSYELSYDINNPTSDYPGRTYQYYKGTPVYPFGYGTSYTSFAYSNIKIDKTSADANDTVTVTADIENTGSKQGTEVAQLYVTVPGADGKTLPLKQLKGFERVTLNAGEKKTVSFSLDLSDVFFFNEASQKNYVINGEYTIKVGGDSQSAENNTAKLNVSGTIAEDVDSVYAIPSGLKVYGAKDSSGNVTPASTVDTSTSVTLKNDYVVTDFKANGITMKYESANPDVATVDENGIVSAGQTEGTTTITITATKGDSVATTTLPIVTQFKDKMSDSTKAAYLKQLEDTYKSCPEVAYTAENWAKVNEAYQTAHTKVSEALLEDGLKLLVEKAVDEMKNVPKIQLTESYTVVADNSEIIKDNRIEYSKSGIGEMTVTDTSISGTITTDNPATINMKALSGTESVTSSLIWTVERLDSSSRKNADIDMSSGVLTLYTNGVYKITASDYKSEKCGSIIVYANLQIEGEDADSSGGANLNDEKDGASGGKDAGSTNAYWLRFDGVKLDTLTNITFRVSQKDAESTINVSLMPNSDWIIASATAPQTGAWTNWTEVSAEVNRKDLERITLDENGCATIYVQTNKANLDYIRFNDNKYRVSVPYDSGVILAAAYENGAMVKSSTKTINGAGEYIIDGFTAGENAKVFLWNNMDELKPLENAQNPCYDYPAKSLIVYNFSDSAFDSFFDSAEGTSLTSGFGMDGMGGWNTTTKNTTYTYNGRKYTFTRALKGGTGNDTSRKVWFTPDSDGAVTAIFNASTTRCMYIQQGENQVVKYGTGKLCEVQMNVKAGEPVYVYGGGSNKDLYAVIFEADKQVVEETPPPTETPIPTEAPVPETDFESSIQFEDFSASWTTGASIGSASGTEGGKMVENTKSGDIFYFGEYSTDGLKVVNFSSAIRNDAGNATLEAYAADVTGIDVASASKSDITKLLTSENSLGKKALIQGKNWNTYYDHNIVLTSSQTGKKGIFVKLTSDGKYAGNFDFIKLKYTLSSATGVSLNSEPLTAESDSITLTAKGDTIELKNKYDGQSSTYSFSAENGKNVTFKKLINMDSMIGALVENKDSGKTEFLTTALGKVWIDSTPDFFAESDTDMSQGFVMNDCLRVDDQTYFGCDNGILITMTNCSKCTIAKKVCDFDIATVEYDGGVISLIGKNGETYDMPLNTARQAKIKGDAAKDLINSGAIAVDVRTKEEFSEDSIEGSINVPLDEFENWLKTIDDDTTIIVYCASGMRADRAVEIAYEQDFTNIYNLGSIDELR